MRCGAVRSRIFRPRRALVSVLYKAFNLAALTFFQARHTISWNKFGWPYSRYMSHLIFKLRNAFCLRVHQLKAIKPQNISVGTDAFTHRNRTATIIFSYLMDTGNQYYHCTEKMPQEAWKCPRQSHLFFLWFLSTAWIVLISPLVGVYPYLINAILL